MRSKIKELIMKSNSIVLLTHENPDGDAIGCSLAMSILLKKAQKDVDVIISKIPELYKSLEDIDIIKRDSSKEYDLAIVLDCASRERVDQGSDILSRCKKIIVIDHHISNTRYGDLNYVLGESPACAQVLYGLFKSWKVDMDKKIGTYLMIGILTDTGGFRNNNVNKDTYLMCAKMMELGVNIYNLYDKMIARKSMAQYLLTKIVLDRLVFFCDGKIAYSYINKEDFLKCGAKLGDHEGLVNLGRNIQGVEVSIFVREDDKYYISFRSNGLIKVNKIAALFGGGGHDMAAGANSEMNLDKLREKLIIETTKVLEENDGNTINK